jgi:hypothetical protein
VPVQSKLVSQTKAGSIVHQPIICDRIELMNMVWKKAAMVSIIIAMAE